MTAGGVSIWTLPDGWSAALVLLRGTVRVNGGSVLRESQMLVLDGVGQDFSIESNSDAVLPLFYKSPQLGSARRKLSS